MATNEFRKGDVWMDRACRLWEIMDPFFKPGVMLARRVGQTLPFAPLVPGPLSEQSRFHEDGRYIAGTKLQHDSDLIKWIAHKTYPGRVQ